MKILRVFGSYCISKLHRLTLPVQLHIDGKIRERRVAKIQQKTSFKSSITFSRLRRYGATIFIRLLSFHSTP